MTIAGTDPERVLINQAISLVPTDVGSLLNSSTKADIAGGRQRAIIGPRSELRSYFGLRGNGMNPSRFGILTLGSDCALITSFDPMTPLRLRI